MRIVNFLRRTGRAVTADSGERIGIKTLPAFDGLRGYMAWWVVSAHALQLCGVRDSWATLLMHGAAAVNVFVCLSGFVITHLLLEKREPYGAYLTRRAFRIFPIYWFALLVSVLLAGTYEVTYRGAWIAHQDDLIARADSIRQNFATHVLLHLPLAHGLIPDTWLPHSSDALLGPAWSLSLEWQFYIVAPLLVLGLTRSVRIFFGTLIGLGVAWWFFKKISPLQWNYPAFLPLSLHFFAIGMLSRVFLPAISRAVAWLLPTAAIAAAVAPRSVWLELTIWIVFLCAAAAQLREARGQSSGIGFLAGPLGALASNRLIRKLGECSYSTYLIHVPLLSLSGWMASRIAEDWTQPLCVSSTVVALVLLIPISALLYRYLERPCIQAGSRVITPHRPVLRVD